MFQRRLEAKVLQSDFDDQAVLVSSLGGDLVSFHGRVTAVIACARKRHGERDRSQQYLSNLSLWLG